MIQNNTYAPGLYSHTCANLSEDDDVLYNSNTYTWKYYEGPRDVYGKPCDCCPACGEKLPKMGLLEGTG